MLTMLMGALGWIISILVTIWYLRKFHELHQEVQTVRRYLQAIYERLEQGERRA